MRYGFLLAAFLCLSVRALDRPGVTYKVFQFPPDKIPRVDGNSDDWAIVPDDYAIGMDQLVDDTDKNRRADPKDLDVKIKVGWVNPSIELGKSRTKLAGVE